MSLHGAAKKQCITITERAFLRMVGGTMRAGINTFWARLNRGKQTDGNDICWETKF